MVNQVYEFATYAAMTGAGGALVNDTIYVTRGVYAENDGGFGFWRYDSSSTATADSGTVLAKSGGGAGRFFRLHQPGIVHVAWFDLGFDAAVNAAIATMPFPFGGMVLVSPGSFTMNNDITLTRGITLKGGGRGVTTITQTSSAKIIVGGSGSTTDNCWIEDLQINAANGASNPTVVFDRCSLSGMRRISIANVDYHGVDIGTNANPSSAVRILLQDVEVLCDGANSSGVYVWGGGALELINFIAQGTNGQGQTCIDINNSADIDTIYISRGGTGDTDYGFRWRGYGNLSNVFAVGTGWDRCAQGAIVADPAGTASGSDWVFEGIYAAGIGSTNVADAPAILLSINSSRSLARVKFSGLVKDARQELFKIQGAGSVSDIDISGLLMTDGARAAANTYPAFRDAVSSGTTRLHVSGCTISATASSYTYCIRVDVAGTGTAVKDVQRNTFGGAVTADIYFNGSPYSG